MHDRLEAYPTGGGLRRSTFHSLNYPGYVAFIFDTQSNQSNVYALLVVDFSPKGDDIKTFLSIPSSIQSIENHFSIENMDFEDFRTAVHKDGIFRGFAS